MGKFSHGRGDILKRPDDARCNVEQDDKRRAGDAYGGDDQQYQLAVANRPGRVQGGPIAVALRDGDKLGDLFAKQN